MKITIITVCYNSESTIEKAILSIINQNYEDLEYIIVDGGSTDGTVNIIKKYESYIHKWISEPDQGIYDAMNKGIKMASGEVIGLLNSDDWHMEDTLKYVHKKFLNKDLMILCGEGYVWQDEICIGSSKSDLNEESGIRFRMTYFHPGTFCRKKVFEEIGYFDTRYLIAADYAWLLKAYDSGIVPTRTHKCLSNFRRGGISSKDILKDNEECKRISVEALNEKFKREEISEIEYEKWLCKILEFRKEHKVKCCKKLLSDCVQKSAELNTDLYHYIRGKYFRDMRIGIFGTGVVSSKAFLLFKYFGSEIVCFYDNNEDKIGKRKDELPVLSGKEIRNDAITIIASTKFEAEIEEQLIQMDLREGENYIVFSRLMKQVEEDMFVFYD